MKTTLEDFVDKTLDLIMFQFFHFAAKKKLSGISNPKYVWTISCHRCGTVLKFRINSCTDETIDAVIEDASSEVGGSSF